MHFAKYEMSDRTLKFIQRIYTDSRLMTQNNNGSLKQTFVFMNRDGWYYYSYEIYNMLRKLQNDNNWSVIILCNSDGINSYTCPSEIWMPLHRLVYSLDPTLRLSDIYFHQHMADLANLIKNPDYNRFQFYQSLPMA